ncbi:hypothetical protein [Halovivax limisalsi]|uniref:hypothetical protein n=1 Tax=Halovivax limisalsi TaxID=1453760 RepID=UPI001FFC48C2|nr:hypothetical protein [Halovivax limisalsi]
MSHLPVDPHRVQLHGTTLETAIVVAVLTVGIVVGTTAGLAAWHLVGGVDVVGHLVAIGVTVAVMVGLPVVLIRTIQRVARVGRRGSRPTR